MVMSLLMGLLIVFGFWMATRKATAGVPCKWQAFVEMLLEFVDSQVKDTFHGDRSCDAARDDHVLLGRLDEPHGSDSGRLLAVPLEAVGIELLEGGADR